MSINNTGLGPEAVTTIAESLIANDSNKLKKLCISRSRVEEKGAKALARYFATNDKLEHLEIINNAIRDDAAVEFAESLLPCAKSGSLKHLDVNDNSLSGVAQGGLLTLIREATKLEHLDISGQGIDDEDNGLELLEALKESTSKMHLRVFNWSYDAFEFDDLIGQFLDTLSDKDDFPQIKHLEFMETISKVKRRNKLRKEFRDKNIELVLTEF